MSGSLASCPDSIPLFFFCFGFFCIMTEFNPFLCLVLRHCAQFDPFFFVSGSQTSCLDSIHSFCFWFSGIVLGFFFFFIISNSPASCPDSIPSFCFGFSGIVLGFHYLFRHHVQIFLIFLGIMIEHRLSFPTSRPAFSYLFLHHVLITHLPRYRARVSLSPSVVATQFC